MRSLSFILLLLAASGAPATAAASVEKHAVYVSGTDGYHTYRIPAVIRAKNGDFLAFCEGRKHGSRDTGDIDLLLKRSTDGGRTWGRSRSCGTTLEPLPDPIPLKIQSPIS